MTFAAASVCGPEGPLRAPAALLQEPVVKTVLFDFSGTLFQIDSYAARIRSAMKRNLDENEMDKLLDGLESGLSDPDVVAAQRGRDVSAQAHRHAFTMWYSSVPELAPYADALYGQLKDPAHWLPYSDVEATLSWLHRAGLRLGVVSDVGWDLRPTFAHHGLDQFFSAWVHSYEHGTEKPDPQLFYHACQKVGVNPDEALMVGDHPAKDGGAAAAGLRAYVLPAGAAPGAYRGLDAVRRLVSLGLS